MFSGREGPAGFRRAFFVWGKVEQKPQGSERTALGYRCVR